MIALILKQKNLILYAVIGAISASIDFGVYSLLTHIPLDYLLANVVSVHCGILCSFILNREFNFKVKDKVGHRFVRFYLIGLLGLAISSGLLYFTVNLCQMDSKPAKLGTIIIVALIQFVLNKFITFKR